MTNEEKAKILSGMVLGFNDKASKEQYDIAIKMAEWKDEQARESFCLAVCKGRPPRSTCTSLGTCDDYDRFSKLMRGAEFFQKLGKIG